MATRLSRPEQTERNRGLVLDAARRVFLERGYAGATVEAIADEAGFSKGVVYSQFASKADVMFALLDARIAERSADNAQAASELAGHDGLRAFLQANARRSQESMGWARLLIEFRAFVARDPELNARYAAAHARTVERFAAALEAIAARGGLRFVHDATTLAELVLALDAGSTLERLAHADALPNVVLEDIVARLAEPR
jgi:AcrR family transcriptional regulator